MLASAFNQPLSLDTSSVSDMASMFNRASAFNQPLSFDISSVTDMGWMFDGTDGLSDANKLLIRCAWSGSATFVSQYGSEWSSLGACPPEYVEDHNAWRALHEGTDNLVYDADLA